MLTDTLKKIKKWGGEYRDEIFIVLAIVLVGVAGFGLGRFSKIIKSREPILIEQSLHLEASLPSGTDQAKILVGSKNGTKYHFPWCPGALKISEKNKVWFESKGAAEQAGYTKAGNCAGL